ncbi:DNA-deoxyinosine glycosylase [Reinekea sp.]|jgi:hypoxanthine-DNA glycosylase|uniref:DNA-deoxyinosine glycosylase n=1 Tax=Reinekea sp. TaxID=1970455 RepID=UPI002A80EE68|nr:DNA-deoxyinosine glycosylase [Reinekea sp.]
MALVESFSAVQGVAPRILVLGSMPGIASLQHNAYYAHPRNAFWPIMASYFQFDLALPYAARLTNLTDRGVALWDVLQRCERPGSLDSAIKTESMVANRIDLWLQQSPSVVALLCNGGKAGQLLQRYYPSLAVSDLHIETLPSTSPAYAALPLADKTERWHQSLQRVSAGLT